MTVCQLAVNGELWRVNEAKRVSKHGVSPAKSVSIENIRLGWVRKQKLDVEDQSEKEARYRSECHGTRRVEKRVSRQARYY